MESHLESGCWQCKERAESWRTVVDVRRGDPARDLPADVVRIVKAAFWTDRTWGSSSRRTLARLTFDSLLQPAAAGVRGAGTARQLTYEAGPLVIDLRIQSTAGKNRRQLIGQVLDSRRPEPVLEDVEVAVEDTDQLLSVTRTNASGEFSLDFPIETGHKLLITLPDRISVQIDVP
jgi:hypothetical protein